MLLASVLFQMKRLLLLLFNKPPKWYTICTLFQKLCSLSEQKPKKTELHREPPICTCRSAIYRRAEEEDIVAKILINLHTLYLFLDDSVTRCCPRISRCICTHTHTLKTAAAVFLLFPFLFLFTSHFSSFYTVFLSCSSWFSHSLPQLASIISAGIHKLRPTQTGAPTLLLQSFLLLFFGVCFHWGGGGDGQKLLPVYK